MIITESNVQEYNSYVTKPFSVFDSTPFAELNAHKVEAVKYLLFSDSGMRFGLVAGIQDGVLKAPFSAPYGCFSKVSKQSKVLSYTSSVQALTEYARSLKLKKIRFTLPPLIYDSNHISKIFNSLYINQFRIAGCDLNYHFKLARFDDNYLDHIDIKAKQKLRSALKSELTFEKTSDYETAYHVIAKNRQEKNYPLWMTLKNVEETIQIIKADFFLVHNKDKIPIAACMAYHISADAVQVIYWGSLGSFDQLKPMNFLVFKVFEYYSQFDLKIIDTGPSTEFSIPNYGLCDFKQSIGCSTSTKMTFELDL